MTTQIIKPVEVKDLAFFIRWIKENLFSNLWNSILTVITGAFIVWFLFRLVRYIFITGEWSIITVNQRLFFIGIYPAGEEWRFWPPIFQVAVLVGISYGIWGGKIWGYLSFIAGIAFIFLLLGFNFIPDWLNGLSLGLAIPGATTTWWLTAGALALTSAAALSGRYLLRKWPEKAALRQAALLGWVLLVPAAILFQIGISGDRFGGLFVDLMVFAVGGFFSFPLGILLALGRSSSFSVIRISSTVYIEIIRAGPLLVWLLLALFVWGDFLPSVGGLDNLDNVYRAMFVFSFFGAAYIAEVIRGGLQSMPKGQYEAAQAVGLNTPQTNIYIILPQAIKAVLPAIVGRFISLWRDTALLVVISLINTLKIGAAIREGQLQLVGSHGAEIYLIVALLYWIGAFTLSRLGGRVEKSLKAEERNAL